VSGYDVITGLLLGAIIGVRAIQPGGSAVHWVAFGGNVAGVLGALLAVLLTLQGARAAMKTRHEPGYYRLSRQGRLTPSSAILPVSRR
jgi:hypothetical protein